MRIVVSDSSCLIDLRKVSMLELLLRLPCEFLIPNTLFDEELIKFTQAQKNALVRGGLKVVDLPGERVLRARGIAGAVPQLSVHDAFAFALAEAHPGCILLSGDERLRRLAAQYEIEVHGVLWVLDQLYFSGLVRAEVVVGALTAFQGDATVRLPRRELAAYLKRYETLMNR